jgi:6-phosphogluconolactonase
MSLTEDGGICDFASSRLANINMGPRKDRQKKAYAHCMVYTPDGKMIGVIDLGCDSIFFYDYPFPNYYFLSSYSAIRCRPHFPFSIKSDPGDGPRHAIFSRCGKYFFVLNELSSSVTSYAYDGKRKFTRIGKWSMLPKGTDPLTTKAAAIKLTADGKVLMASNRGCDSIAFFEVKDNGELELKNIAPLKGKFPRDFELMPGEKFMVVGHKMSNEIQVYSFDRAKYTLTPIGDAISCYRPLCFKFLP